MRRATFAAKVAAVLGRMACFAHVPHDDRIALGATGALISLPRYKVPYVALRLPLTITLAHKLALRPQPQPQPQP